MEPYLDHVTIRVADLAASTAFYRLALEQVGFAGDPYESELGAEWQDFSISPASDEKPGTRRLHIGFRAPSRTHVDRFWQALTAAGHPDDGPPGPRPQYRADYYGGFVLDPDGNSVEAVHHGGIPDDDCVLDHLWLRTGDLAAQREFYAAIAPPAGIRLKHDGPDRIQLAGEGGSFSLVPGEPTRNVHLAFSAPDRETVDRFHAAALAAGYRDNGAPGERPEYHRGYYGAFVLDPDGHNVEAVFHDR
jgi:catechol 2,3-dioxygenase-like lactoylglutathione lyase family enzyme